MHEQQVKLAQCSWILVLLVFYLLANMVLCSRNSIEVSLSRTNSMVFEFAQGYNNPVLCGQPVPSTPKDLLIVAGVSNSALQYPNGIWHDNLDLTFAHGQAWATMINDIKAKLKSKNLFPDIKIAGGYDSEFYGARFADCRNPTTGRRGPCPDPNSTEDTDADMWTVYGVQTNFGTLHWAQGYDNVQSQTEKLLLYNFGSCEDCPRTGTPSTWNGTELEVFNRVSYLTWALSSAVPYPQIYHEQYPYEWYNARWYARSVPTPIRNMTIWGAMTECGDAGCLDQNPTSRLQPRFDVACHPQTVCTDGWVPYNCLTNPCPDFPPSPGWQAITDMLNSHNMPDGTPNPSLTPQPTLIDGVTDIQCQLTVNCP
jgi:hypothetical protein